MTALPRPVAGRTTRQRATSPMLIVATVVALALLGATLAGLLSVRDGPRWTASALLQVDAPGGASDAGASADAVQTRVQTELLVLDSADLASETAGEGVRPEITATQVATTAVIELSATASTAAAAESAADAAATLYQQRRTAQVQEQADADAAAVEAQLSDLATQIGAVDDGDLGEVRRQALLTEYTRLVQSAAEAQAGAAAASSPVTVLVPASRRGAEQQSSPWRDAATGALLGALVGVALAVIGVQRRPRAREHA